MDKLLLTPEEAAEALAIGRSKVYDLIGQGRLSSVRIDACRRIPVDALIDFVQGLREIELNDGQQLQPGAGASLKAPRSVSAQSPP